MTGSSDEVYETTVTRLAFGSCHNRRLGEAHQRKLTNRQYALDNATLSNNDDDGRHTVNIWESIARTKPNAWLWTGDAIYLPKKFKGDGPIQALKDEYDQTLAIPQYSKFVEGLSHGIFGTWDDHDYGGNDRGKEMADREARRDLFLDFLNVDKKSERRKRAGVYNSITFGEMDRKVKVIFLDTRWHRDLHMFPSLAASKVPLGSVISCFTRLLSATLSSVINTAGFKRPQMLGEEQWKWLESQVNESDAQINIIVSSVQVLTTNPVVESWGHFREEQLRLIRTIKDLSGCILLSGDVHHAELISIGHGDELLEVTSSGLTHSCKDPFYGRLCKPILESFSSHRSFDGAYVLEKNFGTLDIDWNQMQMTINIHNFEGRVKIQTTRPIKSSKRWTLHKILELGEKNKIPFSSLFLVNLLILVFLLKKLQSNLKVVSKDIKKS